MTDYKQKINTLIENLRTEMQWHFDEVYEHAYRKGYAAGYDRGYEDGLKDGDEDKQEQKQDAEIKVGDEVITKYKDHAVAVRDTYYIGEDREPFTLIWFGTHMSSCRVNELSKTGKHYPQIAEVLKEMRGEENDE